MQRALASRSFLAVAALLMGGSGCDGSPAKTSIRFPFPENEARNRARLEDDAPATPPGLAIRYWVGTEPDSEVRVACETGVGAYVCAIEGLLRAPAHGLRVAAGQTGGTCADPEAELACAWPEVYWNTERVPQRDGIIDVEGAGATDWWFKTDSWTFDWQSDDDAVELRIPDARIVFEEKELEGMQGEPIRFVGRVCGGKLWRDDGSGTCPGDAVDTSELKLPAGMQWQAWLFVDPTGDDLGKIEADDGSTLLRFGCDGGLQEIWPDADGDGYGAGDSWWSCGVPPAGWATVAGDCDDDAPSVNPGALEQCDGVDNDCDGPVDDADPEGASDAAACYRDADGDGYGSDTDVVTTCLAPEGYVARGGDCDDGALSAYPGALEQCDGIDNDCDGGVDDADSQGASDASVYYRDADADGYGSDSDEVAACMALGGYVTQGGDCDDDSPSAYPGALEQCDGIDNDCDGGVDDADPQGVSDASVFYRDADADGYGSDSDVISSKSCLAPDGYVAQGGDCDDSAPSVSPGAFEQCDGLDNDCDGWVDDADPEGAADASVFHRDADGDGYGSDTDVVTTCLAPEGYVARGGDCDDGALSAYPGALEQCDGLDNDCNGWVDDADPEGAADASVYYRDADADGYGSDSDEVAACMAPGGYVTQGGDCDDDSPSAYPGALEQCDGIDNDCDGGVDDADPQGVSDASVFYRDADADGYGSDSDVISSKSCLAPDGYVAQGGDCDDSAPSVSPGAFEQCDGLDNDCDGATDEDLASYSWYFDADGDGFGDEDLTVTGCREPAGYTSTRGDCADDDALVYPGAEDAPDDGVDSDCGGTDGADPHVGLSNSTYASLQEALDAAEDGQTVWVGPGTYLEHGLTMSGKAIALRSTNGESFTVVDAQGLGTVVYVVDGEGPDSVVDGFTLTGGYGSYVGHSYVTAAMPGTPTTCGGGVAVSSSSPTLAHLTVAANTAPLYGGGMFLEYSSSSLTQVTLTGNSADEGGGMCLRQSNPSLTQVILTGNIVEGIGGGMSLEDSSPTVTQVTMSGNTGVYGGGMYLSQSSPTVTQVTMSGNTGVYGGGMCLSKSSPLLTQVALAGNSASGDGAGMYFKNDSSPTVTNSVIAYNTGSFNLFQDDGDDGSTGSPTFRYCDIYDPDGDNLYNLTLDSTNLTVEPGFLEAPTWDEEAGQWMLTDLHLALDSPLVDAGDPNSAVDPDGSRADIGIYGGPDAGSWDRDGDGYFDWFWPGTIDDAPAGFDPMAYDLNDGDPAVY